MAERVRKGRRTMLAWAIVTNSHERPGFIGCGWFGVPATGPRGEGQTATHQALTVATFSRRREARWALLKVTHKDEPGRYSAFPAAKVVRVEIIVREVSGRAKRAASRRAS